VEATFAIAVMLGLTCVHCGQMHGALVLSFERNQPNARCEAHGIVLSGGVVAY
jgi:sulfite exporter TauE/SafE